MVLISGIILLVAKSHSNHDSETNYLAADETSGKRKPISGWKILWENDRESLGYYVVVEIPIMDERDLTALGTMLVKRMRGMRKDHLKAWLVYDSWNLRLANLEGREFGHNAIWMNAVRSDGYKINLTGAIPQKATKRACYDAYVAMQAPRPEFPFVYDDVHDILYVRKRCTYQRINMPAIIVRIHEDHLPGGLGYTAWDCMPELKKWLWYSSIVQVEKS